MAATRQGSPFRRDLRGLGPWLWVGSLATVFIWSAIQPKDYYTWLLEVFPAVIAAGVLAATRRSFPLTPLAYLLILAHAVILMVGGHYTYAEVPLFDHIADLLDWQRNNYDKLGHLAQGFVPAIVAREVLIRLNVVNGRGWLSFLIVCFTLAVSAFYELLEWWVALLSREAAEAFLGTQGYVWDTQSDMAWALFGAVAALVLLGRIHDRQLERLMAEQAGSGSSGFGPR
jgi:putative membrane protein